jgi:hypothetical protein
MLAYVTILCVSIAGLALAPFWVVLLGTIALASLSYAEHYLIYQRGAGLGFGALVDTTLFASALNAFLTTAAAYGIGALLRFLG